MALENLDALLGWVLNAALPDKTYNFKQWRDYQEVL